MGKIYAKVESNEVRIGTICEVSDDMRCLYARH